MTASTLRPIPDDYASYAGVETVDQLKVRYRASPATVARWNRESGRPSMQGGFPARAIPADFAALSRTMTQADLAERYGVCRTTIKAWERKIGIVRERPVRAVPSAGPRTARVVARPSRDAAYHQRGFIHPYRDDSIAGQAAEYLRRYSPLWRCDQEGKQSERGRFWRRGSFTLTDAELIQRAQRLGWAAVGIAA